MEPNSTGNEQGWFSRERVLLVVLGLATLVALYVCYLIVQPFMPAIVIASAVAIATKRPHTWLRSRLRSNTAAAAVTGAAIPLVAGVLGRARAEFDVSRNSALVYRPGPIDIDRVVSWIDSRGNVEPLLSKPARYLTPRLSPDGRRLAIAVEQGENANVWVYDWSRDTLTPGEEIDWEP
jgi:hypothetical protein